MLRGSRCAAGSRGGRWARLAGAPPERALGELADGYSHVLEWAGVVEPATRWDPACGLTSRDRATDDPSVA
jgi:hypothetical protein